ncbi:P-loop NTPase fold protein [Streptomyces cadmiisoli]|uniref:P-loop NTPase fold protein n=1 Tax=Streptomyces cadmiisoli TaxID=2184053 RepID=UPI003D74581B
MAPQRPWIIEDCAITSHKQDRFDHQSVARELLTIVRGSRQPLAVGLLGPFGSGKSSVVRLLDAELQGDKEWAVLHLSAERHTGTARARGLLYGVLDEALGKKLIKKEQWESGRACLDTGRQRTAPRPNPTSDIPGKASRKSHAKAIGAAFTWILGCLIALWALGAVAVLIGHAVGRGAGVPVWTWFASPGARPLTTSLSGAAVVACVLAAAKDGALSTLKKYEITLTTPRPESSDDLEQVFSRLIDSIDRRLVIAIDDIDRLAAAEVLEALATVRSLLLTGTRRAHPPVFLLSCDEDIVREAIVGVRPGLAHAPAVPPHTGKNPSKASERKATEEAAQEYLNKLFTVRLTLPAHHESDLRQYIQHLITEPTPHELIDRLGGISAVRDVLETLIHPGVRDPRHAIRLLNSFLTDYGLALRREQPDGNQTTWIAVGEVTGYPVALARLTVLRHDYRTLYDAIRRENELLTLLDDALLGTTRALYDPLVAPYTVKPETDDEAQAPHDDDTPRLDTTSHPGLVYLRTTAAKARLRRPTHLVPLLTLGSTPASRALGSEGAAEVQRELLQRDSDALRDRLQAQGMRERVLQAAAEALQTARPGLDLDNTLAATVQALAQTPDLAQHLDHDTDTTGRALLSLTDRIASRRQEATTPVPAHHLAEILDLVPSAHLPSLYNTLGSPPPRDSVLTAEQDQPSFTWAQALMNLPSEEHARALRPAVTGYFTALTHNGDREQLWAWIVSYDEATDVQRALWPAQAFRALMGMTARISENTPAADVRRIVEHAAGHHQWARSVMLGAVTWLSTENDELRSHAMDLLLDRDIPADGWGAAMHQDAAFGSTVATELIQHAAAFLTDDDDADRAARTADQIHGWLRDLGDHTTPSGQQVSALVAEAVAQSAHTSAQMANAAVRILPDLQQDDATSCVSIMAGNLATADPSDEPLSDALAQALITFMRVETDNSEAHKAADACLTVLTTSLAGDDARGAFARRHLPAVATTPAGRQAGPTLVDQFLPRLSQHHIHLQADTFSTLHVLMRDRETRTARLEQIMQHLYGRMSTQPVPNVTFAAHYAADPIVNVQWLTWMAQHWASIPDHERTLTMAAACRQDLPQSGLPPLLLQHLLATEDTEAWHDAAHLWDKIGTEEQNSLLASARGRCPQLADRANEASQDVLVIALGKARTEETLLPFLALIATHPQASQAIATYLDDAISGRDWDETLAAPIACGCPDPTPLWDVLIRAVHNDQTSIQRASSLIAGLLTTSPRTAPASLAGDLAPVLRTATADSATAIGQAVRPARHVATALRASLHGHTKTTAEKDRTAAFKRAAGIR